MKALFPGFSPSCLLLMICSFFLWAPPAAAELTTTFEVSGRYEDNVTGVARDNPNIGTDIFHGGGTHQNILNASGPGGGGGGLDDIISGGTGTGGAKQSDFSTTLYADIGTLSDLTEHTSLLLLVSVEHTVYSKFNELDFTVGTLSAGIGHRFSDVFSGRLEASVARRDVTLAGADSTIYGLTASLKQRVSSLWFRESATVEQGDAKDPINDYNGTDVAVRAGYDLSEQSSLSAGYSYLKRDFPNSAVGAQTNVQAASLDWNLDLDDHWSFLAGYDREWIKVTSDLASGTADNNVYSVGLRYDF